MMKKIISIFCVIAFAVAACAVFCVIYRNNVGISKTVDLTVDIDEYVFCVEEAVGDSYNVRILYSLKRRDGGEINPQIRFGSLQTDGGLRSLAGSVMYRVDEDKKTIWIEEEQSSYQQYNDQTIHTVVLENLTFGESDSLEPIEGTWYASYKIQIDQDHIELIDDPVKIQDSQDKDYYYRLSDIQISNRGIYMEMKIPDNDIYYFADHFQSYLVMKNGETIDLDLHLSIRGKRAPFKAYATAGLDEMFELDDLYCVVVCGHEILVGDK